MFLFPFLLVLLLIALIEFLPNDSPPFNFLELSGLATTLIIYHKTIYHSAMCRASIYSNYPRSVVRREVSVISELAPLIFVFSMAI